MGLFDLPVGVAVGGPGDDKNWTAVMSVVHRDVNFNGEGDPVDVTTITINVLARTAERAIIGVTAQMGKLFMDANPDRRVCEVTVGALFEGEHVDCIPESMVGCSVLIDDEGNVIDEDDEEGE